MSIIEEARRLQNKYEDSKPGAAHSPVSATILHEETAWINPPPVGKWKINFDGSFLDDTMTAAAILRDGVGIFYGALSRKQEGGIPLEAEACNGTATSHGHL